MDFILLLFDIDFCEVKIKLNNILLSHLTVRCSYKVRTYTVRNDRLILSRGV